MLQDLNETSRTPGIYCIQNQVNGNKYVGSAVNLRRRQWEHLNTLRKGIHYNPHLQRSCDVYGLASLEWIVLENISDVNDLVSREQHYINFLDPEYNIMPNAFSFLGFKRSAEWIALVKERNTGKTHTSEVRARLSAAHKGRKQSPELIAKRSAGLKGHKVSDEARAKISAAQKGRPSKHLGMKRSAETRAKMSEAQRGHAHNEESKQKLSIAHTGKQIPAEVRAKISTSLTGKAKSREHADKVNAANRGQKRSEETKAKLREAWKIRKARKEKGNNNAS